MEREQVSNIVHYLLPLDPNEPESNDSQLSEALVDRELALLDAALVLLGTLTMA
jgi:hypothetical protein